MAIVDLTKCNLVIFLSGTVFRSVPAQAWPESIRYMPLQEITFFPLDSTSDVTAVSWHFLHFDMSFSCKICIEVVLKIHLHMLLSYACDKQITQRYSNEQILFLYLSCD